MGTFHPAGVAQFNDRAGLEHNDEFGGGWFFVAASEAISVLNQEYTLPGIGSYVTLAVMNQDLKSLGLAMLTMAIVIVPVDQLFWKPIIAWTDKFRLEQSAASEAPQSWLLDLLRASRLPRSIGSLLAPLVERVDRLLSHLSFATSDILHSKELFRQLVLVHAPLVTTITLDE